MSKTGAGAAMYALMAELYPICRSLSGQGVRDTLSLLERELPLERTEVPSGTRIFDWTVPREWNIRGATLDGPAGRVVDFTDSNLHVLGYSAPVRGRYSLDELRPRLFSDPDRPTVTPFRTSYHDENWGFCLPHLRLEALPEGEYEAVIDSTLEDGYLTYAEALVPGTVDDEVLLSTYIDHPSLGNDNLSGVVVLWALMRELLSAERRRTYRALFGPATLGPLCWLAANEDRLDHVRAGLVISSVGDPGAFTYKSSRRGGTEIDRAVTHVLRTSGRPHRLRDWSPLGGDERQFCSPGFDLAVGALSRTPPHEFAEYHSSADDLDFVRPEALEGSLELCLEVVEVLEANGTWVNTNPKGEPQLGRRGLYRSIGGGEATEAALLWVLSLSDGSHDLLAIADRAGLPFGQIREAAQELAAVELLVRA
jgi:aminopeptidase-like protein